MDNKPRVGVGIMLIREGKVLLGKRHLDPDKADSELHGEGTWTFPGGKLDFGETLSDAVKREVSEETGLKVEKLEVISVTDDIIPDVHFVTIGFLSRDFFGEAMVMEPDEITEWRWFEINSLPDKIFSPTRKMIDNFLGKILY